MIPDDHNPYAELKPKPTQGISPSGAWPKQEPPPFAEGPPQDGRLFEAKDSPLPTEGWEGEMSTGANSTVREKTRLEQLLAMPEPGPTDMEMRAGIDSLDLLLHRRKILIEQIKETDYLFGGGRKAEEAVRRQHRDIVAKLISQETKIEAQNRLESLANADPRHIAFTDKLKADYNVWIVLKNELNDIEARIEARIEENRTYNREVGLAR